MVELVALQSLKNVSSTLKSMYQLRLNKIHKFKPKVEIYNEVGPFILKTVNNVSELREALKLRYQVFHREMRDIEIENGVDVDEFDLLCDHLIIIDKKSNKIVGTYRMNCTLFTDNFYSAKEFHLHRLMKQPGIKIELGRACIHKDHRRGVVISLLWRGIADYMIASGAQFLFGCASVKTQDPREAALMYKYFQEDNRFMADYFAPTTTEFTMPDLNQWIHFFKNPLTEAQKKEAEALIPPLFRAYLKVGCYLGGPPAWDEEFKCIDFLTILHKEDLNRALWKKYKLDSGSSIDS